MDLPRAGGQSAAFPAGPHPQHQVDVLPGCEQRFVEASGGEERLPVEAAAAPDGPTGSGTPWSRQATGSPFR